MQAGMIGFITLQQSTPLQFEDADDLVGQGGAASRIRKFQGMWQHCGI
jgi:hypothetical protein